MRAEREQDGSGKAQPAENDRRRLRRTTRRGWRGIVPAVSVGLGLAGCEGAATGPASGPGTGPAAPGTEPAAPGTGPAAPVERKAGMLPPGVRPVKPGGHLARVACLAFSPDGQRLLSGSEDGALILWDVQSGEIVQRLEGHQGFVAACAFLPGDRVVSGGAGGEVFVWDVPTGKPLRKLGSLASGRMAAR